MQEAEADLEKLRIMGLAIAGLRIALAAVWTREVAVSGSMSLCRYVAMSLRMSVGSSAEEEKVGSSQLERWNAARREEQRKIVLPLWHWRFAYNRPRANSTDTGASHLRCGLVICTMRSMLERMRGIIGRTARKTNYRGTRGTRAVLNRQPQRASNRQPLT
jgi:hypothetical protein